MNMREQARWLQGFLDSLLVGGNVSKGQMQLLKRKIENLINSLDNGGTVSIEDGQANSAKNFPEDEELPF